MKASDAIIAAWLHTAGLELQP